MDARRPFRLRGIDTDNGHGFINHHLLAYVRQLPEPIEFPRSRARQKNDNAHVEQKNATHVREQVGCERFDHPALAEPLRRFYEAYELFRNLFIPGFKLLRKARVGAKVRKIYGDRTTPCERLLHHPEISPDLVRALRELRDRHDPIDLALEVRRRKDASFQEVRKRGAGARHDRLRRAQHGPFSPPVRTPAPLDSHPRLDYHTKQPENRPTALPLTDPSVSWSFEATWRARNGSAPRGTIVRGRAQSATHKRLGSESAPARRRFPRRGKSAAGVTGGNRRRRATARCGAGKGRGFPESSRRGGFRGGR